jgi:hypothetical protein
MTDAKLAPAAQYLRMSTGHPPTASSVRLWAARCKPFSSGGGACRGTESNC